MICFTFHSFDAQLLGHNKSSSLSSLISPFDSPLFTYSLLNSPITPSNRDRNFLIPVANTAADDDGASPKPSSSSTSSSHNAGREERANMMVRMNGKGSDHQSWETGSYVHEDDDDEFEHDNSEYDASDADEEEDAFDVNAHLDQLGSGEVDTSIQLDHASFPNDEAYARALQDDEDQEMVARLLALTGIHEMVT